MQKAPPTPKGFRDLLPDYAKKRRDVIRKIEDVLVELNFVPVETPTIEFAETLSGKYGAEEKLIYKFKDRGERELALRYDLTVPLARFVANNQNLLKPTFSRYQIGQVFRGENPQHGRYREFTQLDFDTVGITDFEADARIIAAAIKSARTVGQKTAAMAINDRKNFSDVPMEVIRAIDKVHKVGEEGVIKEITDTGISQEEAKQMVQKVLGSVLTNDLQEIFSTLEEKYSLQADHDFFFDPSLARGLDYYTGVILELKTNNTPEGLSLGGGGRYDNLVGMFAGKQIPAVGFSFGLDRLIETLGSAPAPQPDQFDPYS